MPPPGGTPHSSTRSPHHGHLPLVRTDAGVTLFSTWRVGTPERQRATVDAIARVWEREPWPTPDLLAYRTFAGEDGETIMHGSYWTDEAAYEAFAAAGRRERVDEVDAAVPGIERVGPTRYAHYRSTGRNASAEPVGAVVAVRIPFDGPDVARLRAWVDGMVAVDEDADAPLPGLVQAHFHTSHDGTHALNVAEWTSVRAHVDALGSARQGSRPIHDRWREALDFPGIGRTSFVRYRPAWGAEAR
ncbi:antibiotic biosynthesis monooxygenase [Streptomyces sp. G45]|uniref:antibiotic biosynthesis monooxygenase n=1 Tax=Streptomyces sp. G45 TaxID=3406627 RepID=UPI003C224643